MARSWLWFGIFLDLGYDLLLEVVCPPPASLTHRSSYVLLLGACGTPLSETCLQLPTSQVCARQSRIYNFTWRLQARPYSLPFPHTLNAWTNPSCLAIVPDAVPWGADSEAELRGTERLVGSAFLQGKK